MARLEKYIQVGQQQLRCGYTTGTCATGASLGAALALLEGTPSEVVTVQTPTGIPVELELLQMECGADWVQCAVCKDGGDDPDVTHGALIFAKVWRISEPVIIIDGGFGVGRVTRAGLDQPVGQAAINSTPRNMISKVLTPLLAQYGGGLQVEIFVPEGENLAKKTFNPRMGIVGGISILGTSGIVRPMSTQALMDTTSAELSMLHANGVTHLILTPGNYGEDFARDVLKLDMSHAAICSNYIGFALDCAVKLGFSSILLVGHIGKLSKVAAGAMDTHSKTCDPRREVFCTHGALAGGDTSLIQALYQCVTADASVALLSEANLLTPVMQSMGESIQSHLSHRCGNTPVGAIYFSNKYGVLGESSEATALITHHTRSE